MEEVNFPSIGNNNMLFGTSSNSMQEESCLVSEEVAQDAISYMVQLMPPSFSKREEGDDKVAGCLHEREFDFYYP